MDVDVEMVDSRQDSNAEDGPTEDFKEPDIMDNPTVRRQNRVFVTAMLFCVAVFAIYVVGKVAGGPSQERFPFTDGSLDSGTKGDNTKKVSNALGKYNHTTQKGWITSHPNNHGHFDGDGHNHMGSEEQKIKQWQDATVTLQDGIKYEILEQLEHDKEAFTEGLCFTDGRLFESVGLKGKSDLRELDPSTGKVQAKYPIQPKFFGEGLTVVDNHLVQLTWKSKKGFKYEIADLTKDPVEFEFSTTRNQGWGLTYDPVNDELIESDGSANLHFWDPKTMKQTKRVDVTRLDGTPAKQINELEFWRGRVLANIWYKDIIIVINPDTGVVEKEYDFKQLWPEKERTRQGADVLNGISVSDDPDVLYVTGKNWDRMFKLKLLI